MDISGHAPPNLREAMLKSADVGAVVGEPATGARCQPSVDAVLNKP
jgi:hypothetical protein